MPWIRRMLILTSECGKAGVIMSRQNGLGKVKYGGSKVEVWKIPPSPVIKC
jgi:hypothetical protein